MSLFLLLAISFFLSLVPFSVALSSSVYRCIQWKEALRIALVFALFEAGFLAIGWLIGFSIKGFFNDLQVPVAALIIFFISVRMFSDSRKAGKEHRTMAVESGRILAGYAFIFSINTVFISMGPGILQADLLILSSALFGFVFLMTIAGIQAGKRGMMNLGQIAEMAGSAGLVVICVIIILQYLKIL
jgi:putative Mn2+ efflux pump MntP